ncbi:NHL domain-containing thioredoxin family protein [Micrococcoides hystricis]|uniref:NHL domain-containing thioredoxin family protein n=1 Tax=Micrococcoides hystricis TaxID=1572761 RepID=A0ABV6PCV3_9MICC
MPSSVDNLRTDYRVRASELTGRGWLNTGGKDLDLAALKGKIVVLDFWTFCCINCLHVLDELRPLEEKYADVLVTIGVHSPKFEHEAKEEALVAAVERYEINHPVLDDPNLETWQAYTARAWPTLIVIDPEGYIVAHLAGEGHANGLGVLIEELIAEHEAKGTLHRGQGPFVPPEPVSRTLRFPGKANELTDGTFLVVDSGHHRLVRLANDLETVLATYGSGVKGYADGPATSAQFNEPQGVTQLPEQLAGQLGYHAVVADTVNHRLRSLNLDTGEVGTLAGNGVQRLLDSDFAKVDDGDPLNEALSSPWDVHFHAASGIVVIAMAGTHQIFHFDPVANKIEVLAGNGLEGLQDGPAEEAWFAQPSGLAEDKDGAVWVADSETSALRKLTIEGTGIDARATTETAIGTGLFDFGFRDGAAEDARLQHPLGVEVLPDGSIAIADTYNGAIRRYNPATKEVSTLTRGLNEPADILITAGADGTPMLLVSETNAHQLIRMPIPADAQQVDEGAHQTQRPPTKVSSGAFELDIRFAAPAGQKLDDRWGDPTQLQVSSSPENLILSGDGTSVGLHRTLEINPDVTEGVLHITARAAACDGEEGGEIPDHAACHLYQQDWGIPLVIDSSGATELVLDLRGVN